MTCRKFGFFCLGPLSCLLIIMSYTGAYEKLASQRPRSSLVSVPNIVSLLGQILFIGATLVGTIIFLQEQKWYVPVHTVDNIFPCWENTAVFLVSCFQYIIIALLVSDGPPYRKHLFTNYAYLISLTALTAFTTLLIFNPFPQMAKYMGIVEFQPRQHLMFRLVLFMVVGCNLFLALAFEMIVAKTRWLRWLVRRLKNKTEPKNEFKRIEKAIALDYLWPPIDKPIYSSGPILIGQ